MCAIVGAILKSTFNKKDLADANFILKHIWNHSYERGRDGRGFKVDMSNGRQPFIHKSVTEAHLESKEPSLHIPEPCSNSIIIANLRAEPTTEYVAEKQVSDQQPYSVGLWSIVHNGTIANDKDLRTYKLETSIDSAAIAEQLNVVSSEAWRISAAVNNWEVFLKVIRSLKGSYAILAHCGIGEMYVAANYRPVWYAITPLGIFFASARNYFPDGLTPIMLEPYTAASFDTYGIVMSKSLLPPHTAQPKALVVCSGGLDSVVSAAIMKHEGYALHLIHFLYGSRAEGPEVEAVKAVAKYLDAEITIMPLNIYSKEDSPLLDPDSLVAGGEAGAEFAHEWVPARNLLLLSMATAFAEARGIETIVLGNNLEEAGAYPDNEPEFIARFNDILPFAVGAGKRMKVLMPVGNMMKHEIVAAGHMVEAPMHLTWSCYRADELHCGTCGPCYMRRKAFEINGLPEVIQYQSKEN